MISDRSTENNAGARTKAKLTPKHLADLRASELSDEQIAACRFYSETDPKKIGELLNWKGPARDLGPCLVIPFFDADGNDTGYRRLKPDRPRKDKKSGKPIKYESPIGSTNRAYIPPGTRAALKDPSIEVAFTEGEKKAAKADQEGIPCIGLVGVDGWSKKRLKAENNKARRPRELIADLATIPLNKRPANVTYDSDAAENKNVSRAGNHLAKALTAHGAVVRIVCLPAGQKGPDGKPTKVGLDDFLKDHGPAAFRKLVATATPFEETKTSEAKRLTADKISILVMDGLELWHTPDREAFATTKEHPRRTFALDSTDARRYIMDFTHRRHDQLISKDMATSTLDQLDMKAVCYGLEYPIHVRVAGHNEAVYLDLGDKDCRAVKITREGWELVNDVPVKFRRPRGLRPLPEPRRGGRINDLRPFVNVPNEGDWQLLVGWLLSSYWPVGPYPILNLQGEQGAAKSTTARVLRSMVDPNKALIRALPKEERDLMISAHNGWIMAFDNLSNLPTNWSDIFCRMATGGGYATRSLFTNSDEEIFECTRPVIFTAIEELAVRGDVLDRFLIVNLPAIDNENRRTEEDFWKEFEEASPRILGAILNVVAAGLAELPHVQSLGLPRMADFCRRVIACESALGWTRGSFAACYQANISQANELALEGSIIWPPLQRLLDHEQEWEGTATKLLEVLRAHVSDEVAERKEWPKNARSLSGRLQRLSPNLRKAGVQLDFRHGGARGRSRVIQIAKKTRNFASAASAASAAAF